jgi:hypothetical protein
MLRFPDLPVISRHRESDQRLCEIAGIGCDALLRSSKHRMASVETFKRRAARSGIAFVAIAIARRTTSTKNYL